MHITATSTYIKFTVNQEGFVRYITAKRLQKQVYLKKKVFFWYYVVP